MVGSGIYSLCSAKKSKQRKAAMGRTGASRTIEMVDITMSLFARFRVNGTRDLISTFFG